MLFHEPVSCSIDPVPQLVVIGLQKTVDHILEFGDKMNLDSLQEGLIPDTETLSRSNLPFTVHWIAESSKAVGLPTSQTTHTRTT